MRSILHIILVSCFVLVTAGTMQAQSIPDPPNPPRLVNDYTGTLTSDQQQALERKLVAFDDSTTTQIAVILIKSLDGYDISDYALQLGRKWGVGGKEFSNGVVLLIAIGDRKVNISTGYGAEGALPDITCKHIIDDIIRPNFRDNDYYRGIDEGTTAMIKALKGEYTTPRVKHKPVNTAKIILIIILVILFLILSSRGGGGTFMSRRGYRGYRGPVIWGSGWGSGGSWGGGSGGSSGGGFGGFGGGSFGGGGASGSW